MREESHCSATEDEPKGATFREMGEAVTACRDKEGGTIEGGEREGEMEGVDGEEASGGSKETYHRRTRTLQGGFHRPVFQEEVKETCNEENDKNRGKNHPKG